MSSFVLDHLTLDDLAVDESGFKSIRATIVKGGLSASARVVLNPYLNEEATLVAFLEEIAREWRGWSGAREWAPQEGTLSLELRHDGVGHVHGTVTLGSGFPPEKWHGFPPEDWSATVGLWAEPGFLSDLSIGIRRLLSAE